MFYIGDTVVKLSKWIIIDYNQSLVGKWAHDVGTRALGRAAEIERDSSYLKL